MNYPTMDEDLLTQLRVQGNTRRDRWHGPDTEPWTGADWGNAMGGEVGEAQNVVKKLRRLETGTGSQDGLTRDDLLGMLSDELGDVIAYADLLAQHYGLDLRAAVARKFNRVSQREGLPREAVPVMATETPEPQGTPAETVLRDALKGNARARQEANDDATRHRDLADRARAHHAQLMDDCASLRLALAVLAGPAAAERAATPMHTVESLSPVGQQLLHQAQEATPSDAFTDAPLEYLPEPERGPWQDESGESYHRFVTDDGTVWWHSETDGVLAGQGLRWGWLMELRLERWESAQEKPADLVDETGNLYRWGVIGEHYSMALVGCEHDPSWSGTDWTGEAIAHDNPTLTRWPYGTGRDQSWT